MDEHLVEFEEAMEKVTEILEGYLRRNLEATESPATVEIAMVLFREGWTGSIYDLIRVSQRLAGAP